jgi:hypothetical protein
MDRVLGLLSVAGCLNETDHTDEDRRLPNHRREQMVGSCPSQRVRHDPGALSPITLRATRSTRFVISEAARREKVINNIRRGSAPWTIRCATRWASSSFQTRLQQ